MFNKKFFLVIAGIILVAGICYASAPSTGSVDNPSTGSTYTNLTANQALGATVKIGQNTFKYVKNITVGIGGNSSPAFQGEPAFLMTGSADGYSVTNYRSSSYDKVFDGIWYCNASGGTQINGGAYGWIQTSGVANALVSQEAGTAYSIAEFDTLVGKVVSVATTDASARCYMVRATTLSSTAEAFRPMALETVSSPTAFAFKKVYLQR
jgi:hypothetical protein